MKAPGVCLALATLLALLWANSPWQDLYFALQHLPITIQFGSWSLSKSFHHWVNDGLMVVFFFVVGLEIKKELFEGRLSSLKKATLPIMAAAGGMVVPALIYAFVNRGLPTISGWAIPMATDIAFAMGVLSLFGSRVPAGVSVFLLALAIVDDLGAVAVIAAFYTATISPVALSAAVVLFAGIKLCDRLGLRSRWLYFSLSIFVWLAVLFSGVHATVAGVVLGFLTPLKPLVPWPKLSKALALFSSQPGPPPAQELQFLALEGTGPADQWIRVLHPWVYFLIMPLFALINSGVSISDIDLPSTISSPVAAGISLGLLVGKPLGILLFSFVAVRLRWAELPSDVRWPHVIAVSALGGIGFTMSLFVAHLSFTDVATQNAATVGILLGSAVSAALGAALFATSLRGSEKSRA
jgi:Na+:H+ antiporter, NhaA family